MCYTNGSPQLHKRHQRLSKQRWKQGGNKSTRKDWIEKYGLVRFIANPAHLELKVLVLDIIMELEHTKSNKQNGRKMSLEILHPCTPMRREMIDSERIEERG